MTRCSVPFCSNNANHRFPKDPKLRNSWLKTIGRDDFVPTNGARICRKHFHRSDYVQIGHATGLPLQRRCLKKSTVPSVFTLNRNLISNLIAGEESRKRHQTCKRFDKTLVSKTERFHSLKIKQLTQGTQTLNCSRLFATEQLLFDDESVLFYTGLDSYAQFTLLLSTLLPMANEIKYLSKEVNSLSVEDQFLMLLIKLRRSKPDFEIGKMFGVNKTDVSNVIVTWICFITDYWSRLDSWPNQNIVNAYMPQTLRGNCPFTGAVEIPIKKEISRKVENASFSHYRLKKTMKFLTGGCTPDELVFYCLEPQVASTGDLRIRDDESPISGIMGLDQKLAKSIPMERLIGSTKMFKILSNAVNQIYAPLSPNIFSVCLMICSIKVGIVTVCNC